MSNYFCELLSYLPCSFNSKEEESKEDEEENICDDYDKSEQEQLESVC